MPLDPGTRLGQYEIVAPPGARRRDDRYSANSASQFSTT